MIFQEKIEGHSKGIEREEIKLKSPRKSGLREVGGGNYFLRMVLAGSSNASSGDQCLFNLALIDS